MIQLILRPSVPDFGWVLDFGDGSVRPATTWYSEEHRQLVISNSDMSRLPREHIALVERFEADMIAHIAECERQRHMRAFVCGTEAV
jgi:hypothetical protein